MDRDKKNILCVNGGSTSIKFCVYEIVGVGSSGADSEGLKRRLTGKIDRIGLTGASLTFADEAGGEEGKVAIEGSGMEEAAKFLLDWLGERGGGGGWGCGDAGG